MIKLNFGLSRSLISLTDIFPVADGYLGGICKAEAPSGCLEEKADCKDSICQCVVEFSDINGTCKAGKILLDDTEIRLLLLLYNVV